MKRESIVSQVVNGMADYLLRGSPFSGRTRGSEEHLRQGYRQPPPFSDLLPWLDILADGEVLLEDGRSVAAVVELQPVDAEGRPEEYIETIRQNIAGVLTQTFDEYARAPWILQVFAFTDRQGLLQDWQNCAALCSPVVSTTPWHRKMRGLMDEHLAALCSEDGGFFDSLSGSSWRGCRRRVLLCIYRRGSGQSLKVNRKELSAVIKRLTTQLKTAGMNCRMLTAESVRQWLRSWFDPLGKGLIEADPAAVPPELRRFDYSLADAVCSGDIRSDDKTGQWQIDGVKNRVLILQSLRGTPTPGQLSLEHCQGDLICCPLEQLPEGTVTVITLVFSDQQLVQEHLEKLANSAIGESPAALACREGVDRARRRIIKGDKVFAFSLAVYVRGGDAEELNRRCDEINSLFQSNHLQLIPPAQDPVALDAWLRHLPMAYRYSLDQVKRRNRLIYSYDAAALLPFYGRSRGSGKPGLSFFNRGGELNSCNPLDLTDRTRNAHLFLFGPTGSGKSALLVYLQMMLLAFQRPRIIAVEAGNSYGLLADYLHSEQLDVIDIVLNPGCGTSLAPFASALQLAQQHRPNDTADSSGSNQRDLLGEMVLIAKLMITGGLEREEGRFSRADEAVLQEAIIEAAGWARDCNNDCVTVSDVRDALKRRATGSGADVRSLRWHEMADAMGLYTVGFAGELFDRKQQIAWLDADYVRIEIGTLATEQYRDKLSVAWLGLINSVIAMAEKNKYDGRPTILLTDEAHVITGNPLLASYVVKISKLLGRRLGLWLWMATQNIRDFQDEAEKMLAMFEWWLCLHAGRSELQEVMRFKQLSPTQQAMMLNTHKISGLYTEGILLSDTMNGRFRNVMPPLCLALAQTEKDEKSARFQLMKQNNCSELEAALEIARQIAAARSRQNCPA